MRSTPSLIRCTAAAVSLFCCVSVAAQAEDAKGPNFEKVFTRKDNDKDGLLSLEEFKTSLKDKGLENADKAFKRFDKNGDGKLSLEEFKDRPQRKKK